MKLGDGHWPVVYTIIWMRQECIWKALDCTGETLTSWLYQWYLTHQYYIHYSCKKKAGK